MRLKTTASCDNCLTLGQVGFHTHSGIFYNIELLLMFSLSIETHNLIVYQLPVEQLSQPSAFSSVNCQHGLLSIAEMEF